MRIDTTMTYTNGAGESVRFAADSPWHYGGTDLRDHEWKADTVNDRVVGFRLLPREFSLEAVMDGASSAERDRMVDVFDHDVIAGEPGTLRAGSSEMRCWVTAAEKDLWWYDGGHMRAKLTVRADDPVWTRETVAQFRRSPGVASGGDLDYPHGYPHDWKNDDVYGSLSSPYRRPCAARITVYGPAVNPYVIIGTTRYQVDVSVPERGLLVIDGRARTIVSVDEYGRPENAFSRGVRAEGANIFAKVPAGSSPVSWGGQFGFDVALVEERSEPAWS